MGEIYLTPDIRLGRRVALKILPTKVASDQKLMQRFIRQARAASALSHPNITTIHDIEETASMHFIATEFIVLFSYFGMEFAFFSLSRIS